MRWIHAALVGPMMIAASCSAVGDPNEFGAGGAGGSGGAGASGTAGPASSSTGDTIVGTGVGGGGQGGGGTTQVAEVYGHGPSELYRLDPITKEVTVVGPFKGCFSVIDIAMDKDSNLYGATGSGLYLINKESAQCTLIQVGDYPNSLSFVPEGTVDANKEALVGYLGSSYVRIDTATGDVSTIGSIGGGYSSSGDIVSVIGGKTYLTVTGPNCDDCIIEVNPKTGALVKNYGALGYGDVFGLAFWAGSAYGFTDGGQLFEVQFSGDTLTTTLIPIPGNPANLQFWGAGSTTSAPPDPIPQ